MTVHMTIAIDETVSDRLRALADIKKVSPEELAGDVLAEHLDYKRWFSAQVQKGLDCLAEGRTLTHEEVEARAAKRRAELLARSSHK